MSFLILLWLNYTKYNNACSLKITEGVSTAKLGSMSLMTNEGQVWCWLWGPDSWVNLPPYCWQLAHIVHCCLRGCMLEWRPLPHTVPNDTGVGECVYFTRVVMVCGSWQYFHMLRGFGLGIKSRGGNKGVVMALITQLVNFSRALNPRY